MWRFLVVVLAAAAAFVPTSSDRIERLYSTGAYPLLQRGATALSNAVPFALFDALLVVVIGL